MDAIPTLIAKGIEQALTNHSLLSHQTIPTHAAGTPDPTRTATEQPRQLEFTISVDKVDPKHEVKRATGKELLTRICDAFHTTTSHTTDLTAISKLPNGNLVIRTPSEDMKNKLTATAPQWLPRFAPEARLSTRSYVVVVHSVSTDLDLSATPKIIADDNPLKPGSSSILGTRWLNERT